MNTFTTFYRSPIGNLKIVSDHDYLLTLDFVPEEVGSTIRSNLLLEEVRNQLNQYFGGKRKIFDVPFLPRGTEFQRQVWQALQEVPFGETASYADIAKVIGNPNAVRAVGMANHYNPIAIIIPCHRIIGSNGKLTGYAGELWRKEWLLKHEGLSIKNDLVVPNSELPLFNL